ncbi:MAG TPA: protein kinase [Gemmatimonadaceae bacterium]|nr:protein kinase [Gemmatimonadaceae bacterium]
MARRTPAISLTWKIFLGGVVVVAAVSALTLAIAARSARRAADAAVTRGLAATRAHVRAILDGRERGLEASAQAFGRNPNFRALFENRPLERSSFLDQAGEALERIGANTVHLTDAHGVRFARSDDPAAGPDTLARSALIARALAGRRSAGAAVISDTMLHQAVAVPIEGASARVIGVLMATRAVGDSLAREITAATSGGVVFFALDSTGRPRISGASVARDAALTRFLDERAPIWAAADAGSAPTAADLDMTGVLATEVTLGETRWVASGAALRSAGGVALGGFVALRSLDAEMAAFARLERSILLATVAGLLVAFGLSYLMARAITRRVGVLEAATRRAADGDYAAEIRVRGGDEIARLAESVRSMLTDLRDKRDLVEFLSAAAGSREHPRDLLNGRPQHIGDGLQSGQKLAGRYEITELIGSGGMGIVYRALDLELSEPVAVKTLRREYVSDSTALARFRSELRLARRISHRNVMRTHDLGETDGMYFITMEYVRGTSVKALITERGRLPVHATLPIARQLCRALEVAHEQGIIHRDIKPHNLVLAPDGVLKVMDFGVARLLGRTQGVTQTGMVVGTPEYLAPEQLLGEDVDARADIYAVGVVIYECLTGRTPHTADDPMQLISRVLEQSPVPPHELVADVPRTLSDAVLAALHRDRGRRPRTMAELHELLVAGE